MKSYLFFLLPQKKFDRPVFDSQLSSWLKSVGIKKERKYTDSELTNWIKSAFEQNYLQMQEELEKTFLDEYNFLERQVSDLENNQQASSDEKGFAIKNIDSFIEEFLIDIFNNDNQLATPKFDTVFVTLNSIKRMLEVLKSKDKSFSSKTITPHDDDEKWVNENLRSFAENLFIQWYEKTAERWLVKVKQLEERVEKLKRRRFRY